MRKTTRMRQWLLASSSLLLLGLIASSCSDSSNGSGANNCSFGRNACEFGCSPDYGCVDCLTNSDCGSGAPICALGRCVDCGANGDCATGQVCAPATHQCTTGCQADADCTGMAMGNNNAPICDASLGACVGCTTNADCSDTPARPICDSNRRQCSQCASRTDCGVAAPACNLQTGNCEECLVDADCQIDEACTTNHQCRPLCQQNSDCNNNPGGAVCNPATGACVECLVSQDCTNPVMPVCSAQNRCAACSTNADCPTETPICNASATGGGGMGRGARCVACVANTDCTTTTAPICSQAGLCVQCENDQDCTDTALPNCNNQGVCVAGG